MKTIIKIIKNIFLLPYTLISLIESKIVKRKDGTQKEPALNETVTPKYFISMIIWAIIGFFIFRDEITHNRIVHACPSKLGARCYDLKADYESICDKENDCIYYYTKIYIPNEKPIEFGYCNDTKTNTQTCYTKDGYEAWNLEYRGKKVLSE